MNQILVDINNNIVTVLQSDTNIIQVNTPGPTGIPGPSGSQGPSIPFTLISGNFWVTTSSIEIQGGITGSLQGTSSYSLTASYALNANFNTSSFVTTSSFNNFTSSYNTGSFSGSLNGTSSWAISSSNSLNSDSSISSSWASSSLSSSYASGGNGNFSGSFSGSGANLFNIPSTAITGLNLSQIASGSATASIDPLVFNIGNSTSSLFQVSTVSGITTLYNNLLFNNDNLYDIGASGATRPRTGYFGTSIITPLINISGLTISELVATDSSKNLQSLSVSTYPSLIELSYGKGVTSSIQTQLNNKASITAYTLSGVSTISTTALNSVYQMTSTIPVEFKTSDANTLLYLDETNERVGIGIAVPLAKMHVNGGQLWGTGQLYVSPTNLNTLNSGYASASNGGDFWCNYTGYNDGATYSRNLYIGNGKKGIIAKFDGSNSNFSIGPSSAAPVSKLYIGVAPTASANYGLVSLGNGAFDGSTLGYFSGSANGTLIAGNLASGSTSDLMNLQVGGSKKFIVEANGDVRIGNSILINTASSEARIGLTTRSYFLDVYNEIINSRVGNLTLIASNSIIGIGGTTSSFPALKRNGAGLEVRLADDSGYGNLTTGNTTVTGSLTLNYVAVTTTYSILPTDYTINCTSGTFTVTLPTAIGCTGKIYNIKNTGTGVITLDTTLSQNIDDNLSQTINPKSNLMVQSTGSNYIIL